MVKYFAKGISTVLNPLLLLIPVPYILVLKATHNQNNAVFWSLFTLIFIFIFFIFILFGIKKKYFSDFDISKRSQRPLLFSFAIGLAALYTVFLYVLNAPEILFIAVFALILGLIAIEIVNQVTKVSVHVAMITAFSLSLFLVYGGPFSLSLFLIPFVSWARITTLNHTKKQTAIGALLGALTTLSVYAIFKYII